MGRNRMSEEEKKLRGNAGKKNIPPELEVDACSLRCPHGMTKAEKRYWKVWAGPLIQVGKLSILTVPSFLNLIKLRVRLDEVNEFLATNNQSLMQQTSFVDPTGTEHQTIKESAYSKLSRDLTAAVFRLEKDWGLTASGAAGNFKIRPKKTEEETFLGG